MRDESVQVLLIEDEEFDVKRIRKTIRPFKNRIHIRDVVSDGRKALELLKDPAVQYDVVIMDFQIAGGLKGERLISGMKAIDPTIQIIVVTKMTINITDFDFARKLKDAGALWYCTKYPGDMEDYIYQPTDFILNIFNAYDKRKLEREHQTSNRKLEKSVQDLLIQKPIIGSSPGIDRLRRQIQQCAASETNILIRGDSGTGKELVALNIHYQGRRKFENFIPINCGSLPGHLIESELFGFEKGSFTGADARKPGLFEVADKGTLFLDEITELPLSTQSTLLRVLQEGEIDKIGRTGKVRVDVRVIAATNKPLEKEVRESRFRKDLYYRLNVVSIQVPPLRDRKEDIPLLCRHYLSVYSRDMSRPVPKLTEAAMNMLVEYAWPGNVRELQNVVQRILLTGVEEIEAAHLSNVMITGPSDSDLPGPVSENEWNPFDIQPLKEMETNFRRSYFQFVRKHAGSDAAAARKLGLAPSNYYRMCKDLGLK
jgi:DNA-binding NtrC family response regulator